MGLLPKRGVWNEDGAGGGGGRAAVWGWGSKADAPDPEWEQKCGLQGWGKARGEGMGTQDQGGAQEPPLGRVGWDRTPEQDPSPCLGRWMRDGHSPEGWRSA